MEISEFEVLLLFLPYFASFYSLYVYSSTKYEYKYLLRISFVSFSASHNFTEGGATGQQGNNCLLTNIYNVLVLRQQCGVTLES